MRERLRGATGGELAVLAALTLIGSLSLVLVLARTLAEGGVWSGADGFLVVDQGQYLGWIRQAGRHVLIANPYDLAPGPRSFLHPGALVAGLLERLGLGVRLAFEVFKPIGIVALWAAGLAVCRRFLVRTEDRVLALALGLLACAPLSALVGWTGWGGASVKLNADFAGGELWPSTYLWGYMFTALSVAAVPAGLLLYERARRAASVRPGRALLGAAGAGLVASWLQPWQGATYAVVLVGAEAWCLLRSEGGLRATSGRLTVVLTATGLPLAYFFLLGREDPSWALAAAANDFPRWPWWVTLASLAPLGVPALLVLRRPTADWGERALRLWPLAGLAVFYQPAGTFPFHAFQGLGLPLAVLAVGGVRLVLGPGRRLPRVPTTLAVAVLVVPGTAYRIDEYVGALTAERQAFVLSDGEHDALRFLERDGRAGGVLAPIYLGTLVPAWTGRETWIGAGSWTPDFAGRLEATEDLFGGRLGPAAARRVVRRSGAGWLLSDCHGRRDPTRVLGGVVRAPRRFGCATVWRVSGA